MWSDTAAILIDGIERMPKEQIASSSVLPQDRDKLPTNRKIITLVGSTKYPEAFVEWAARLTFDENATVLSITIPGHALGKTWTDAQLANLTAAHRDKIVLADEIFVLDVGSYLGESVRDEIAFAESIGKPVRYLSVEYPGWDMTSMQYTNESLLDRSKIPSVLLHVAGHHRHACRIFAGSALVMHGLISHTKDIDVFVKDKARLEAIAQYHGLVPTLWSEGYGMTVKVGPVEFFHSVKLVPKVYGPVSPNQFFTVIDGLMVDALPACKAWYDYVSRKRDSDEDYRRLGLITQRLEAETA